MSSPSPPLLDSVTPIAGNNIRVVYTIGSGTLMSISLLINSILDDRFIQSVPLETNENTKTVLLTNSVLYTFRLQQVNTLGSIMYSTSLPATPADVPLTPVLTDLAEGDNAVTFTMNPGALQGGPLLSLTFPIYSRDASNNIVSSDATWLFGQGNQGSSTSPSVLVSPDDPSSSSYEVTLQRLTNGIEYEIEGQSTNLYGINQQGTSPPYTNVLNATPQDITTAPTVTAFAGNVSSMLSIQPPAIPSYDSLVAFWIQKGPSATPFRVLNSAPAITQNGSVYSYNVTGLTNGTPIDLSVAVELSNGGKSYYATVTTLPFTKHDKPVNLKATAGDRIVDLEWETGESDGGLALAKHYIYMNGSKIGEVLSSVNTFPVTNSLPDVNLVNGDDNAFTVKAVTLSSNDGTTDVLSDPSDAVTATTRGRPLPPNDLEAEPGDSSVTLTWDSVTVDTGLSLIRYDVYMKQSLQDDSTFALLSPGPGLLTELTQRGLTNGISYTFYVTSVISDPNAPNDRTTDVSSFPSEKDSAYPVADLPTVSSLTVFANANGASMDLSWPALTGNYGNRNSGSVDGYNVMWGTSAGNYTKSYLILGASTTSASYPMSDFAINNTYYFNIEAVMTDPNGTSQVSDLVGSKLESDETEIPFFIPTNKVSGVDVVSGNNILDLSWDEPADCGALITYGVFPTNGGGVVTDEAATVTGTNGTLLNFTIQIRVANPNSSAILLGPTYSGSGYPNIPPTAITNLSATAGDEKVTLTWSAPTPGGFEITSYNIYISGVNPVNTVTSVTTFDVSLTNGNSYQFYVKAVVKDLNTNSNVEDGPASNIVSKIPCRAAGVVDRFEVTPNHRALFVEYEQPLDMGVGKSGVISIDRYMVQVTSLAPFNNSNISYINTIDNGTNTSLNIMSTTQYPLLNDYAYLVTVWAISNDPNGGTLSVVNKTSLTTVPNGDPIMVGLVTDPTGKKLVLTVQPNGSSIDEVYAIVTDGVDDHPDYVLSLKDIVNQENDITNNAGVTTRSITISTTTDLVPGSSFPPDSNIVGAYVIASNGYGMSMITLGPPLVIYNS